MTRLPNLDRRPSSYTFRVHGANPRGGCSVALLALVLATLVTFFGFALMTLDGVWPWLSIPIAFLLLFAGMRSLLWMRQRGSWAPWTVTLDVPSASLICRERGTERWTTSVKPEEIFLAPMKLREGDARTPPWVLAFSTAPSAPVEVQDPSASQVVFTEGDREELYALADEILNHPAWPKELGPSNHDQAKANEEDASPQDAQATEDASEHPSTESA